MVWLSSPNLIRITCRLNYFVTTPIFYVNGAPHIGHLYTALLADASYRWSKMKDNSSENIFSTGTDEHGIKIQGTAQKLGIDPKVFCDDISSQFRNLFGVFDVNYTDFIRTTEQRHMDAVAKFWETLTTNGFIYKDFYEGWYSTVDEAFYSEDEIEDAKDEKRNYKICAETGSTVEWIKEANYMFRLSQLQDKLTHFWKNTGFIEPKNCISEMAHIYDRNLRDISVSRDRQRLKWGFQVPGDPNQTIYVWFDALVNYLTVAGYPNQMQCWPPDCQIIGRDILRFHAMYWPAFLMAAELPLPKKLFVHSHWTVDHIKMSKSLGNVVVPLKESETLTIEGIRYFLIRYSVPHQNSDFSRLQAKNVINAELANTFGNLLSRSLKLNSDKVYPKLDRDILDRFFNPNGTQLLQSVTELREKVAPFYEQLHFREGIELLLCVLRDCNAFFTDCQPWEMVKHENEKEKLETILHIACEVLRVSGILLQPIVPKLSNNLLDRLALKPHERTIEFATHNEKILRLIVGRPLVSSGILFKRLK